MADKDPVWSLGESQLLYSPTTGLDPTWSLGDSWVLDEYTIIGGTSLINDIVLRFSQGQVWNKTATVGVDIQSGSIEVMNLLRLLGVEIAIVASNSEIRNVSSIFLLVLMLMLLI